LGVAERPDTRDSEEKQKVFGLQATGSDGGR
ncbi:hypothetical protein A2U01_0081655, partial [Trifolium medium]|nr:hypothetical protein [Trifolium medium]